MHARRCSRKNRSPVTLSISQLVSFGLIALVGTGLLAAIDQRNEPLIFDKAASATQEERVPLPSHTALDKFQAPVTGRDGLAGQDLLAQIIPTAPEANPTLATTDPARKSPSEFIASLDGLAPQQRAPAVKNGAPQQTTTVLEEPAVTGAVASRSAVVPDSCPAPAIRAVLADVSARFGDVTVVATNQHKTDNHRSGSMREKLHHDCKAVDFRPERSRIEGIKVYLRTRPEISGVESYRDGVIHMDLAAASVASGRPAGQ
jgi:hypothetical protein